MQLPSTPANMNQPAPAAPLAPVPALQLPPPNPRRELMAVLANVDHLVVRAWKLNCAAEQIQKALPAILDRLNEEEAQDNIWVRMVTKTLAEVAAEQANAPDGTQQWWIIYVGRDPGLYSTLDAAVAQTNKCPNQQWQSRKADKREALDYYRARYEANEVVKWVELLP
ncbi:hypothetical protein DFH08DRAFT_975068 [Mycena albidolilacea]|uniref:Uncharacterized protein n=1 Tax=Mycena albidolilacea TaxID=1033008 RepID=A0AAD6Z5K1_9AGAR|nr:hypothetical protein DFH08DRAFT_975068 [Mycena albidolilacea]